MIQTYLFCVPYAGASASVYMKWRPQLAEHIQVCPLEIAGRGARYDEPFMSHFDEVLNDLFQQMEPYITQNEYALFGHSMGAILVYELYYLILEKGYPPPTHLFISGQVFPALSKLGKNTKRSFFIREKLYDFLHPNQGIPVELLDKPKIVKEFRKIIQADKQILSTYVLRSDREKIQCSVTVFGGMKDWFKQTEIREWQKYVESSCEIKMVNGDHFFIHSHLQELIQIIHQAIPKRLFIKESV